MRDGKVNKHNISPCSTTLRECQMNQMQAESNSFPLGELEEAAGRPRTTWMKT